MKTLFINMAWDCAGVSIRQAHAINNYTGWKARHFRACPTFNYPTDMTGEHYNKDELIATIQESDILHFCQYPHTDTQYFNFGFNWNDFIKDKIKIIHDYALFTEYGYWKDVKQFWNKKEEFGYNDIWSSVPQAIYAYKDCYYMPDIIDETDDVFKIQKTFNNIILGHFPTGDRNRKNTIEVTQAIVIVRKTHNIETIIKTGVTNEEIMNIRKKTNLGFDAICRGFHGMTTIENFAMGVPTMVNIDKEFIPIFNECFKTDFFPFEQVANIDEIVNTIKKYADNLGSLKQRSDAVRQFMLSTWSAKNIADRMVKRYEQLL